LDDVKGTGTAQKENCNVGKGGGGGCGGVGGLLVGLGGHLWCGKERKNRGIRRNKPGGRGGRRAGGGKKEGGGRNGEILEEK